MGGKLLNSMEILMHQQFGNSATHKPPHRYQLKQKGWYFKLIISFKDTKLDTKKCHTGDQGRRQKRRRRNQINFIVNFIQS